jgi:hypothetical protein
MCSRPGCLAGVRCSVERGRRQAARRVIAATDRSTSASVVVGVNALELPDCVSGLR